MNARSPWSCSLGATAAALVAVALAACANDGGTSVRLEVTFDDAWSLDRFDLEVGDTPASTDAAHTVVLLLPDEWAGRPLPISVVGLRGGERHAAALVSTIPELGREVRVDVVLTRLPCGDWCTEGATACDGDRTVVCEQRDSDECFEWSAPTACPEDAPYCSLGECSATCIEECVDGESRCDGPDAVMMCGNGGDRDSCRDWQPPVPCRAEETCSNGRCAAVCADECT
ncbi:MAG: hypothetical protein ACREI7_10540, partial [Myxococcota bacterium]